MSKVVDVARLTATGARIATIIREFRVAAEASSLPTVSALGTAARAVGELSPLLAARAQLFLAEGTVPGLLGTEGLDLLSRPYIRSERDKLSRQQPGRHLTASITSVPPMRTC